MKLFFGSIALLVFIVLSNAEMSVAQVASITEQEFLKVASRDSYRATAAKFPRRDTWVSESFSDGKLTSSETKVYEYLAADKYKVTTIVISNGRTTTREEIQLRDIRYCKKDSSEWELNCPMPPPAAPMGLIKGAEYSLENSADTKTYERKYQAVWESKAKATNTPVTTIDRIILNLDSSNRDRSIITTNTDTKEIISRSTGKVEYEIKLFWIEPPIK